MKTTLSLEVAFRKNGKKVLLVDGDSIENIPIPLTDMMNADIEINYKKHEEVTNINIELITDFPKSPFKILDDEDMDKLIESIKLNGVLYPTIVRKIKDDCYEMIAGHRRKYAATKAGLTEIPCIIKELTDDEATILMIDSNLQRKEILPSEKAFAYKMKLDAMKHQGKTSTSVPLEQKLTSRDKLAKNVSDSSSNIQRYIRLTNLIPNLLNLVDKKRIAFRPAVEISYMSKATQNLLYEIFKYNEATPTLGQSQLLRRLEEKGELTDEKIEDIMGQEKPNQKEQFKTSYDNIRQYFPKNYSNDQISQKIMELLKMYQKKWKNN